MTNASKLFVKFVYLVQFVEGKGWFCKIQFDEQFKDDVEEVKSLLKIVTKHTENKGKNDFKWGDNLVNLEGWFENDEIGKEVHDIVVNRLFNKPLCYGK